MSSDDYYDNDQMPESETKDDVDLLLERERKFAEEFLRMKRLRLQETTEAKLRLNAEK